MTEFVVTIVTPKNGHEEIRFATAGFTLEIDLQTISKMVHFRSCLIIDLGGQTSGGTHFEYSGGCILSWA